MKRDLLSQANPTIKVSLCGGGVAELRVVKEYVHLGGMFSHDGNALHDIERRRKECELTFRRLRATLLRNPCLSSKEKVHRICSLILPKFLHGAGLWCLQRNQEKQAFRAAIMGFLRRSIRPILGASSRMASDTEVCTALQVLLPDEVIARLHVMQLAFLATYANSWLVDTILHAPAWITQALASLQHIATSTNVAVPDDVEGLVTWLPGRQIQLRRLARSFKKACLTARKSQVPQTMRDLRSRNKFVEDGGIIFSRHELRESHGDHVCDVCNATCGSSAALSAHRVKSHSVYPDASFGFGTCCQVCLVECWSENRLRDHLKRHPECSRVYAASDITNGGQLSSRYVAAWQPVAKVQGPQPWWATLQPEPQHRPADGTATLAEAIQAALRPVPKGQEEMRTWILRLFKVMCRKGLDQAEVHFPQVCDKAQLALTAAQLLIANSPFSPETSPGPATRGGWQIFLKADRVELVRDDCS